MKAFWSSIWDTVYLVILHTSLTDLSRKPSPASRSSLGLATPTPIRLALECGSIVKCFPSMVEALGSPTVWKVKHSCSWSSLIYISWSVMVDLKYQGALG